MLNRIALLQSEEARLDRDIVNTHKRMQDLLSRKAEKAKHEDVAVAVSDVLSALQQADKGAKAGELRGARRKHRPRRALAPPC